MVRIIRLNTQVQNHSGRFLTSLSVSKTISRQKFHKDIGNLNNMTDRHMEHCTQLQNTHTSQVHMEHL